MSLQVEFTHNDFIIISKPAGMNFHCEDGDIGVVELAKQQLVRPLWPVHRLDKMTSGLLILACSAAAAAEFQNLFSQGLINKYYLALSDRKPKKKQGLVKGDMEKGRNGSWLLLRRHIKPAITQFFSYGLGDGQRLFLLKPHTGRTHQLRVAMKSLGAPILGDTRYAGSPALRGYLHAYALNFVWKGDVIQLQSHLNSEFNLNYMAVLDSQPAPWAVSFPSL